MIRYTKPPSSPLKGINDYNNVPSSANSRRITSAQENITSLTPLWEFVVRTKSLPDGLDLDIFFQSIKERLQNPEKEIRQYALRVLCDFLPIINSEDIDKKMQIILPDLITNLGHIGPAVRKGAIDGLHVYLKFSNNVNGVFKNFIYDGLEKANENKINKNVVEGIIISLPFIVQNVSQDSLSYAIKLLLDKMIQITYQELTLRTLIRLKEKVGDEKFNKLVKSCGSKSTLKDFNLLCEVYDLQTKDYDDDFLHSKNLWNDQGETRWKTDNEVIIRENMGEFIQDKVILETEIKLNSGPAITMQIHEESRQSLNDTIDSEDDGRNSLGIMKILTDESEDDYAQRRTPRRVRFGGEIVKLRTPDSDSNQPSDIDTESTITITPRDNKDDKPPLIEINYSDVKTQKSSTSIPKSSIPVPNVKKSAIHSEPSSPTKIPSMPKKPKLFRSHPNLKSLAASDTKIPLKEKLVKNETSQTTTIQIKLRDFRHKNESKPTVKTKKSQLLGKKIDQTLAKAKEDTKLPKLEPNKALQQSSLLKPLPLIKQPLQGKPLSRSSSPVFVHKEIEIFHNLTRSPERKNSDLQEIDFKKFGDYNKIVTKLENVASEARNITTADNVLLNRNNILPQSTRNISTADQVNKRFVNNNNNNNNSNGTYNSFQVCSSTSDMKKAVMDSPIPTNNNGDCLTCSSSGSDNLKFDSSWEDMEIVEKSIITKLNFKDDWRIRLKGLEELYQVLQNSSSIEALETKAGSLFHFLFCSEQHVRLQIVSEDILKIIFANMKVETLRGRLNQIISSLCKMGSPAGVRLSILMMRRISVEEFLSHLLGNSILGAKSSKIREGALQILMTISRIFPSTEVNVIKATEYITPLLRDRKKRVRRASLETIAALAQVGTRTTVLNIISQVSSDYPDKEQLMKVVRTRLSRKQLPAVDLNGSIRYSTPSEESELEWISNGSETTSPSYLQNVDNFVGESIKKGEDNSIYSNSMDEVCPITSNDDDFGNNENCKMQNESDWFGDPNLKDDLKTQNLQVWAVDPWTLSTPVKLSSSNGTLRPMYLVQQQPIKPSSSSENFGANEGRGTPKRSPRGRSFSPPKKQEFPQSDKQERFININDNEPYFRPMFTDKLQKSSSSDYIRCSGKSFSPSTSSTSSASTKNSSWQKGFKSGIPVPVGADSKFKFKGRQGEVSKGPMSIPPQLYRTKSPSPQNSPNIISQRAVLVRQPFSSGSESPDFYTPPAEPHLTTNYPDEKIPDKPQSFIEIGSPKYYNENFTVIDNSSSPVLEENRLQPQAPSEETNSILEFEAQNDCESEEVIETPQEFDSEDDFEKRNISNSLDNLDKCDSPLSFSEKKSLSKSEVNLQTTYEPCRKSVSSAPVTNESVYRHENFDLSLSVTQTSIPGSVVEVLSTCEISSAKSVPKTPRTSHFKPLCRKSSLRISKREVPSVPSNPQPFVKAKDGLNETLALLESPDWELTMKGLHGLVRLTRYHPEVVDMHMHCICVSLGKQIRNLRSQVARAACSAASEMFTNHKKALETELEELAAPLLHRTADTNKFLRTDANAALDKMCLTMPSPRVVSILATKGVVHQNAIVRCTATRLLCSITNRLGAEKTFQLPKDTRDKILCSGANMLTEGTLETRKHAKMMFGNLSGHSQFNKAMVEAVPICTMRHIQKTLKALQ